MASRLRIIAVLAVALPAMAFAAVRSPAGPKVAVEASAEGTKFVSKRYGYELVLAGPWKAAQARRAWAGVFPLMDSGEVDVFAASGDRFFIVAATRLPAGTTLRKWERSHAAIMSRGFAFCRPVRAFRSTTLGGVAAREFRGGCLTHDALVAVALRRGLGYTFQFVSPKENSPASDRRSFEAGRRGFRFTSN